MNLAINKREELGVEEAHILFHIIEKMSADDKFATSLVVSDNLEEILTSYNFNLSGVTLKNFETTISSIKSIIAKEVSLLSDKIAEIVARVESGNGAAGW